ncbi:MAG: porin family protein [Prevotella sp.]|nr:outer membrane beta-barrel protein [Prevotella sp.]MCR5153005.1 porin family protein [Prevotella sp.]
MKKILMTLVSVVFAMTASAQVYVGGGMGISTTTVKVKGADSKDVTSYKFVPEVGYNFNDKIAAGVAFGWEGSNKGGLKTVEVNPYARYTFVKSQYVNVFVDGGIGYKHVYGDDSDIDGLYVGFKPGVAVNLSNHLSFVSHIGFIGWEHLKDNDTKVKTDDWGVDVDGRNIVFGLYYNF